jgi:hypothetical protein
VLPFRYLLLAILAVSSHPDGLQSVSLDEIALDNSPRQTITSYEYVLTLVRYRLTLACAGGIRVVDNAVLLIQQFNTTDDVLNLSQTLTDLFSNIPNKRFLDTLLALERTFHYLVVAAKATTLGAYVEYGRLIRVSLLPRLNSRY